MGDGHAARIVTRTESGRASIEAAGAECLIGTPDRLATLRGALDGVSIACWLLSTARGEAQVRALHGARLESFLSQAVDTTMRGFVYEAPAGNAMTAGGERIVRAIASRNRIPLRLLRSDPDELDVWLGEACDCIAQLLGWGPASSASSEASISPGVPSAYPPGALSSRPIT